MVGMVVHNPRFESMTLFIFTFHRNSRFRVARRAGLFARAGPCALVMNKRSKLYCRKEKSMEIIAENPRTVI